MDNRERYLKTMHYETVDHPPMRLPGGPWPTARKRWEQEGLPDGADLDEYFGVEPLHCRSVKIDTILVPPFEEVILEETDDYTVMIDKRGVKVRNFKDGSSMPEFIEYPIKGPESIEWLQENLNPDTEGRDRKSVV